MRKISIIIGSFCGSGSGRLKRSGIPNDCVDYVNKNVVCPEQSEQLKTINIQHLRSLGKIKLTKKTLEILNYSKC